jgi:hypothetical protein
LFLCASDYFIATIFVSASYKNMTLGEAELTAGASPQKVHHAEGAQTSDVQGAALKPSSQPQHLP